MRGNAAPGTAATRFDSKLMWPNTLHDSLPPPSFDRAGCVCAHMRLHAPLFSSPFSAKLFGWEAVPLAFEIAPH